MAEAFEGQQGLEISQRKEPKRLAPSARWPARKALVLAIVLSLVLWSALAAIAFAVLSNI